LDQQAAALNKPAVVTRSAKAFSKYVKTGDELVFFNQLPGSDEWDRIQEAYVNGLVALGWPKSAVKVFPLTLDPAKNLDLIQSYLTAHPGTKGIICADVIAGGPAVLAKKALGLKTPLMSWNLETSTFDDIRSGAIAVLVNQQPYLQSYYAVVNLYMQLKYGFIAPPNVDPGTLIIDKGNVDSVQKQYKAGLAG
jgi:ABC-type sugar transport system substrate-binding protein